MSAELTEIDPVINFKIIGQKTHKFELDLEESMGWFNFDLIEYLKEVVFPAENIAERLFSLPAADQTLGMIFAADALYQKAIENGLIPDDEEYFF